ncbi:MAG TPA: GtrA family protein, partial [Ktedonobacteraceae bacterium]|nr:GtrA family protein [Ktedonobacteraceae bacterium]
HNVISYVIAYEISVMANFIPNDYFTFSHLASHGSRSWGERCLRYQLTSLSGGVLTFAIEFSLSTFMHLTPIIGQAIATLLVLFYNFAFHHLFTYRHKSTLVGSEAA